MGRRGPDSIAKQILVNKRLRAEFSECYELDRLVSVKLKDCLREINRHPWFWTVVYDIPQNARKTFYRNFGELKRQIRCEYLTKSVLRITSFMEAVMIAALVNKCKGDCYLLLTLKPPFAVEQMPRAKGLKDDKIRI